MARYFRYILLLAAAVLVGCAQSSNVGSSFNRHQAHAAEWTIFGGSNQNAVQRGDLSQETTGAGSSNEAPVPALTNTGNDSAATVIAVVGLLALVMLADGLIGCSGSACSSTGTN